VAGAGFEPAQAEPTPLQIAVNVVLTCRQTQLLFSDPVLIAGVATTKFELHTTALVYSASLASLPRQQPASCCSAPAKSARVCSHATGHAKSPPVMGGLGERS
jgi:hypothetical protein